MEQLRALRNLVQIRREEVEAGQEDIDIRPHGLLHRNFRTALAHEIHLLLEGFSAAAVSLVVLRKVCFGIQNLLRNLLNQGRC